MKYICENCGTCVLTTAEEGLRPTECPHGGTASWEEVDEC